MEKKIPTISEIYAQGKDALNSKGIKRWFPPDSNTGTTFEANRKYLDSLFFETKFLDPVEPVTTLDIFGAKIKTPAFCSPVSRLDWMSDEDIYDIVLGVAAAGSLIMLGIGGSNLLQSAIDTGAPVVKMVKPYRRTELIYEKVHDAESRGCIAVGMDIDHFYGVLSGDSVLRTELFAPQSTKELKQVISQTRLPFIIKGVLSTTDAEKAINLGASAVMVSNHGRASVDFSIPSALALPEIVEKVGDKVTILIDSGFKTGNDVFKAIALGAKGVGFAGSMLLALAANRANGVETLIKQITAELKRTMAITGCPNLESIANIALTHISY